MTNTVCFHLYEVSRGVKLIATGNKRIVSCPGMERRGNGELFNGYGVLVLQDEKS